ncbi:MAG: SDR family oxidoreductase [Bdellovibrionota bacterium]
MRSKRAMVIVVTGASAGVGRAVVREFAKRGTKLALIARGRDGLEAAARECNAAGSEALVLPLDMGNETAVELAAERVEKELGPIDIWVNNAMTSVFSPVHQMSAREYRRVTEVTYLGYVWGTLAALRRMRPRNRGTIVQVGSALVHRSIPLQSAYCAAKHAVGGFTESLRCELLHERSAVKVTIVELPAVNTPQFGWVRSRLPREAQPVPPIFQPEVVARAIVHAAFHPRREMDVGFSAIKATLVEKFAPGFADHYLARKGYESQQTSELRKPRPDNLDSPLPGDAGAHGNFDARAKSFSLQIWLNTHRWAFAALGTLAVGAGFLIRSRLATGPAREWMID